MQAKSGLQKSLQRMNWGDVLLNRVGALLGLIIIMVDFLSPHFLSFRNLMNVAQRLRSTL